MVRGLTVSTAEVYVRLVRPFLGRPYGLDGPDLAGLSAADITALVLASAPGRALPAGESPCSYVNRHRFPGDGDLFGFGQENGTPSGEACAGSRKATARPATSHTAAPY